jgi:predicted transposase YbfD/YdcC
MGGFDDTEPPMSTPRPASVLDHFSSLSDPRQRWRVLYPLPEILLLVLGATLSGMEDFVEIKSWDEQRLDFLRRFLPTSGARQRLVLGQEAVDEKSNEIVAIPLLLERLELTEALVTIDAMGSQTDIAEKIVGRGGDCLLALKANRPVLHRDVVAFFEDPPADILETKHNTTDGDQRPRRGTSPCRPPQGRPDVLGSPLPRRAALPPSGHDRHGRNLRRPQQAHDFPDRLRAPVGQTRNDQSAYADRRLTHR